MRLPVKTLLRFARAVTVAAAIIAGSGMLQFTGQPMFAAIDEVALNLAAIRSEVEKLREKVTAATRYRAQIQSVAYQSARDQYPARTPIVMPRQVSV
jgi:hypothetical protein